MFINIKYNSGGLVFQEDEPSLSECRDVLRTAETLANGLNAQGRRAFGMAKYKQHQPFSTTNTAPVLEETAAVLINSNTTVAGYFPG